MTTTYRACNMPVIFIIHWKLSHYTSYFLVLLRKLKESRNVILVDCSRDGHVNNFIDHHEYYDSYISYCYNDSINQLLETLRPILRDRPIIISNSILNNLAPGNSIMEEFGGTHILFEHLSSLADSGVELVPEVVRGLEKIDHVFIPSMALMATFRKYKSEDAIHVHHLMPEDHFLCDVNKKILKRQITYAGRIIAEKNIMSFLKKNKSFFEESGIQMLVIGSGDQEGQLDDFCAINPWVTHLTQATPLEVQDHIDQSLAIVVPSAQESYSMLAVEGMLRGTPVIMQNTGIGTILLHNMPGLFELTGDLTIGADLIDRIMSFNEGKKMSMLMRGILRANNGKLFEVLNYEG